MKQIDQGKMFSNSEKINCLLAELNSTLDLYYEDKYENDAKTKNISNSFH